MNKPSWFHVNGIPVFARSKEEAVKLWKAGKLVRLYPKKGKHDASTVCDV